MKTSRPVLLGLTALCLAGAGVPSVAAGVRGWTAAGRVLTGLAAGSFLARALEPAPAYVAYPAPMYIPAPRVVVTPPPPTTVTYVSAAPVRVYAPPVVGTRPPVVYAPLVPVVTFTYVSYGYRPHFWHRW
ncbi:MAG: hypothetical protein KGS61_20080 [Verrucomicrobia bacterium]|nr:hypothetical protein [Verrucomicrobiota bacterium]